ncbi:EFR1 family ferrodoxin [Anaerorhabdus furcosa]|uniref:4Fe-4S dicluster domain-containing protein n=1 Tax=Anaerorhabdus furcosa TaxID=118967 RepID=A0A1T4KA08_9FIRM|nr:EFR1 family ferrodoxin [Anaerorhabdus furcosa]SJZ39249.1 4Fe-4S dicluster domain-containing protein [Anaerorhabdus furcosa]
MIYYFSGTGNSQLIAQNIAKQCHDQCQSITPYLKQGKHFQLQTQDPLIFVAPTYAWRLPSVVNEWIEKTEFIGAKKVYFVLTCGGSVGNASHYLELLCTKKNWDYQGLASIVMPDNYLVMYPTPDKKTCDELIQKALLQVSPIVKYINEKKPFPSLPITLKEKMYSGIINNAFYKFFVSDKGFNVSSRCISCGKCAQRCPMNNIQLTQGKPIWHNNCTHCMACIAGCPTSAIGYKKIENRNHYFIMNDEDNLKIGD